MYKAVFLDLGRVLVHFDFKRGYEELERLCPYAAADIPRRIGATDLVNRFESGQIEPRDFVRELSGILDFDAGYDEFCRIWNTIFTEPLLPESMLQGLATRYKLILLSNTNAIHFGMLRETYRPLLRHFHHLVLSHEVGAMKPKPEIYRAALDCAGCAPEECFYTDDVPEFTLAARAHGIDAVLFQGRERLERDMEERGIEWR